MQNCRTVDPAKVEPLASQHFDRISSSPLSLCQPAVTHFGPIDLEVKGDALPPTLKYKRPAAQLTRFFAMASIRRPSRIAQAWD
jgi:hypothetical protein